MRVIGIRHRVKKTADGEARPTMVAILEGSRLTLHELQDEQAELDFVTGRFPTSFRAVRDDESLEGVPLRFLKLAKLKETDEAPANLTVYLEKTRYRATKIADRFDGLKTGDTVGMMLGGSGDCLAYAISRQAEKLGAGVLRIAPFLFKAKRDAKAKENEGDEILLAELVQTEPASFYPLANRDRDLITVRECWRDLSETMQDRIACQQRLRQRFIGRIYTHPDGLFPEGGIEKAFDEKRASDRRLKLLQEEEAECKKALAKALSQIDVYTEVLSPVTGVGTKIAARIIAAVVDIRRFAEEPDNMEVLIAESYARSEEHKRLADLGQVSGRFDRKNYKGEYARLNDIARWLKGAGEEDRARHVYALLFEKKVRSQLRRKKFSLSASNLKAFMGVHLLPDGSFPRKRRGQVANWHGDARQALYLLMEQFFKRPKSEWGVRLRNEMAAFRIKHPEVVTVERQETTEVDGEKVVLKYKVKKYNDLHIRKMAMWRMANKFVEWLYGEWLTLDRAEAKVPVPLKRAA